MAVGVHRDGYSSVAQPLADNLRVNALLKKKGGVGVAQVVETNMSQAGLPHDALPSPPKVAGVDRRAQGRSEDQPVVLIGRADGQPLFKLALAMLVQAADSFRRQGHRPAAKLSLGLAEYESLVRQPLAGLLDVKDAGVQVYIAPPEAQKLTLPHSACDCHVHQGIVACSRHGL